MESLADKDASQLQSDILEAAKAGHEDIVARLLSMAPSLVNARTTCWYQQTPLHLAATNGHDGVVAQLLALSPQSSDATNRARQTVLHLAAANGRDKIVERLLAHNPALSDAVDSDNETALHCAACAGHEVIVVRLLNHSPGLLDLKSTFNDTALHFAASGGHVKVVAELLALSPQSSEVRGDDGRTALHLAAANGHDEIVARLLAQNPALIDAVTSHNRLTALHFAASEGHESTVVQLLNHSPGLLDLKTTLNETALHLAASEGYVKVVVELLARGASLVDEDSMGRTPLFCAALEGHQAVVDSMLPLTPDQVHRCDSSGNTLLHLVIDGESPFKPALIQRIWEMNPDALFVADVHGYSPFDHAIISANEWAIEHFQWKFSICSVEESLVKVVERYSLTNIEADVEAWQRREQRFREVMQGECERPLLLSLPRDCVRLIIGYLFISDSILHAVEARRFKRAKLD